MAAKLRDDFDHGTTTVPLTMEGGATATPATPRGRATPAAKGTSGSSNGAGAGASGRKRASAKKDGVITGRVTKAEPGVAAAGKQPLAPKRENSVMGVKEEVVSSSGDEQQLTPSDSFFATDVSGGLAGNLGFSFADSVVDDDDPFLEAI